MKFPLAALAVALFAVPAALSQPAYATDSEAFVGAQANIQHAPFPAHVEPPVYAPSYPAPVYHAPPVVRPGAALPVYPVMKPAGFGGKALVNNNVDVGTQINVQNGDNNSAFNETEVTQTGAAFGGPADGALVNSNVRVGTQLNIQNGSGNWAGNAGKSTQTGLALTPP